LRCYDRSAESPRGLHDEIARPAEDPFEAENVTETRDHGVAASNIAQEILVAQRQQVGLYKLKAGVLRGAFREPIRGPHDRPDADVAAQKLLQDTPAGAPGATDEKYRVLRVHLAASSQARVTSGGLNPLFHSDDHFSSGVTCSKIPESFQRLT